MCRIKSNELDSNNGAAAQTVRRPGLAIAALLLLENVHAV